MTGLRPYCYVEAEFDGFTAEEHARVCREPAQAVQEASDGA